MNIDHAKRIPLPDLLARLDRHPKRISGEKALYLSPLRKEKTPSFWVYLKDNRWYDYGEPAGGDVIDFVCRYLKSCREDHTVADALRWIDNMAGSVGRASTACVYEAPADSAPTLILRDKRPLRHPALIHYLQKRGIDLSLARQHLCEARVRHTTTGKSFFALGFANQEGGLELRNPFFKGSLKPKGISILRGEKPQPERIHLFEGCLDYLSAAQQAKLSLDGDILILNSVSLLPRAFPYLTHYSYRVVCSWLDNDRAGQQATRTLGQFLRSQPELSHVRMNAVYAPHKDVNAWHMHRLTPA